MIGLQARAVIFVIMVMLMVFLISVIVLDKVTENQRFVQKRIDLVVDKKRQEEKRKAQKKKKKDKSDKEQSGYQIRESFIQKIADALFDELMSANIMMKPEEFAFIWIMLAFLPALISMPFSDNPFLPLVLIIVGVVAPIIVIKKKQADRVKEFESQLSDALLICCNCLRSGLTFAQAMENIAEEMEEPIGTEFKRAVNEMGFGATLEEALNGMLERIDSSDLILTVAAVNVQRQTGGNLSQILETISNTIRERLKIKREIRSLTSQGRMSGIVIGLLPVVIAMFLMVLNPDYIMTFVNTRAGNIMLIICIILEGLGFLAINKVVDIKY